MFFLTYVFLVICTFILTVHAALDIGPLRTSIAIFNGHVDGLKSAITKPDGMGCDISILKAVSQLKEDAGKAAKVAEKRKTDSFSKTDSKNITLQIQGLVVKFVRTLDDLVAKEPRAKFSKVRRHIPAQLKGLHQGYTSLLNALIDIIDSSDVQTIRVSQRIIDAAFGRAGDVYE